MTGMRRLEYELRFTTPAFLGDAGQRGQWRTPPFKALLRQWWRVAVARDLGYEHRRLREAEGQLFGHAWLESDRDRRGNRVHARRSEVLVRLQPWEEGTLETDGWPGGPMEKVKTTQDGRAQVSADVYLGFGPVLPPSRKLGRPRTEIRRAIGTDQPATLKLAFPEGGESERQLIATLTLIQWFGALGSRSRNGWGSLALAGDDVSWDARPSPGSTVLRAVMRPWQECIRGCDWPHAIGADGKGRPLAWATDSLSDWRRVMGRLANMRVRVRRAAKEFRGPNGVGGIHLLGYPAGGNWELRGVDANLRLATQLRFKVLPAGDGKLTGLVFHVPCRIPTPFREAIGSDRARWLDANQEKVWRAVHDALDDRGTELRRLGDT